MADQPRAGEDVDPDVEAVNSDTFDGLTTPQQWQAAAVADVLMHKTGAYKGSPKDALTDAAAIVLAMRYAPEGDNHHNARQCPYCNPVEAIEPARWALCSHCGLPIVRSPQSPTGWTHNSGEWEGKRCPNRLSGATP